VKNDKEKAAEVIWICLTAINCLKVLFTPYLPFSSVNLNEVLGFEKNEDIKWEWSENDLPGGQQINFNGPLFKKLEE